MPATLTEHLLTCMAEECAEVAQRCTKALRFGLTERHPDHVENNGQMIVRELADLLAVYCMLADMEALPDLNDYDSHMDEKRQRVLKYAEYSRRCGTLLPAKHDPTASGVEDLTLRYTVEPPLTLFTEDGAVTVGSDYVVISREEYTALRGNHAAV